MYVIHTLRKRAPRA